MNTEHDTKRQALIAMWGLYNQIRAARLFHGVIISRAQIEGEFKSMTGFDWQEVKTLIEQLHEGRQVADWTTADWAVPLGAIQELKNSPSKPR